MHSLGFRPLITKSGEIFKPNEAKKSHFNTVVFHTKSILLPLESDISVLVAEVRI